MTIRETAEKAGSIPHGSGSTLRLLKTQFEALAAAVETAAERLREPGEPPPEDLIRSLEGARSSFAEIAIALSEKAGILPDKGEVARGATSLVDLERIEAFLDSRASAACREALDGLRADFAKVLLVSSADDGDREALRSLHAQARAKSGALPKGEDSDLVILETLKEGAEPFRALTRLLEDSADLEDSEWDRLNRVVDAHFGRQLVTATSRGRLRFVSPETNGPTFLEDGPVVKPAPPADSQIRPEPDVIALSAEGSGRDPVAALSQTDAGGTTTISVEPTAEGSAVPEEVSSIEGVGSPAVLGENDTGEPTTISVEPTFEGSAVPEEVSSIEGVGSPAPSDGSRPERLAWALLDEGRVGIAFHLARALEESGGSHSDSIPSWLYRALALGERVLQPTGAIASVLTEDFSCYSEEFFARQDPNAVQPLRLLLAAAALRPALLAPGTGAPAVLSALRFGGGCETLFRLTQALGEFGGQRLPLDRNSLSEAGPGGTWRARLEALQHKTQKWIECAANFTTAFKRATNVWGAWIRADGLIGQLLGPVVANDVGRAASVRAECGRLSSEAAVRREVERTDLRLRKSGPKEPIVAKPYAKLRRDLGEAIGLAREWLELQGSRPDIADDFFQQQARLVRDAFNSARPDALAELKSLESAGGDPAIGITARLVAQQLEEVHTIFGDASTSLREEPEPAMLLGAELLRLGTVRLDSDWEPIGPAGAVCDAILAGIKNPPLTWSEAFDRFEEGRDHTATALILRRLADDDAQPGMREELEERRTAAITTCRDRIRRELADAEDRVEGAVVLGLVREADRLRLTGQLAALRQTADATTAFSSLEAKIRSIVEDLDKERAASLAEVRRRMDPILGTVDTATSDRLVALIKAGDVLTANEYVEVLARGELLPSESRPKDVLSTFFPDFAEGLLKELETRSGESIVECVRSRGLVGPCNFEALAPTEAESAAGFLGALFEAKRRRAKMDSSLALRILGPDGFGFSLSSVPVAVRNGRHWSDLRAAEIRDREFCPYARYGSEAKGRYRVLWLWGNLTEEQIVTEVGETAHEDATIVVFLGRLSVQRRRDLGAVCWRRSRTFLVVDELLALYLLAQTGPRLSVLFRCTIPFTSIEPFTLSGGLVPPEMFFGRQRERESVLTDSGSCFVYGGRQLGKTALLKSAKRTFEKREDERFAVFVDLEAQGLLRDREDIDAVWSIFSRACAEESIPMKSGTSATADSFCDTLSDWMNKDTRRRVLLLVDEADRFLTEDGRQGGFSRTARLKGLMDKTDRRFKVVFSGLHNVQRTTRLANHPLAHLGEPLCIGPLLNNGEVRAARALVEDTLGGLGFRFASPDLVTRILSQTNYYPSLLQLYCHELLRLLTDTNAPGGLDPRTGPPRVISARHVDDAYSRQGLRKAIEDRFSWTLQLDQRYEVIALTIALASLIPEAGERTAIGDGLAVSWIQSEASYWWAKGFEDGVGEDSFGTLLEEMVGLGILRHSGDGRFALRSPNVVSLMGSKQAIEERLQKERVPSAAFDPSLYRRMMVAGNPAQRSPATVSQESALRGGKPGITVVIGTTLAGLDELPALLKMMSREDGGVFRHVTDRVDLKELHAILREEPKGTPPAFVCTYIRMDAIFDPVWIPRSIAVIEKAKQKGRLRKLVLGIDGTSLWSGLCADKDGFPPSDGGGLATVNLRPWNESMVRVWLDDNRFADIDQIVPRLRDVTGFWPVLLFQFIERAGQRPERWQLELNALAGELNKSDRKDGLKQDLSLSVQGPARVLEVFRTMDGSPGSESDILDLEASLEPADVRRAVAWLEHLRLAQRIGGGGLSLDPVVRRVLLED